MCDSLAFPSVWVSFFVVVLFIFFFFCQGFRLLSPFLRRTALQPARHLGSEEGILGSCSVVRKIMSVPRGAVSGDRSQMQPLLYGRLSFSAESSLSLTPKRLQNLLQILWVTSAQTARERKGEGGKAFPLPLPRSSSLRISRGAGWP